MRRTVTFISIGVLVAVSIGATILLVPPDWVVPALYGKNYDGIELKRIETNWILRKYQWTGSPKEIRAWLTRGHDGALGQQVFYSFVDWGLLHPESFIAITGGVDPAKRQNLIELLAIGVIDNLDEEEFAAVFGRSDAPVIEEIRKAISERKSL